MITIYSPEVQLCGSGKHENVEKACLLRNMNTNMLEGYGKLAPESTFFDNILVTSDQQCIVAHVYLYIFTYIMPMCV